MFTRNTIIGEEKQFEKGIIVASVSDIDDKNVQLKFGYDYDAVIPKEEFDFDIKKDDLVNINIKNLSSLSGPVASFSDVKNFVSITLKRMHCKKKIYKSSIINWRFDHYQKKNGWNYYFEIVEPKGIVIRKDVLFRPDYILGDLPLNSENIKDLQKIARKGIEIVSEYKTKDYKIPIWMNFYNFPQDRIFIDNISIFMCLNNAESINTSEKTNCEDYCVDIERDRNRPPVRVNNAIKHINGSLPDSNLSEADAMYTESVEMERIYDISDCDFENIEEFINLAKSKEDIEMVLIKCRSAITNILKEIIRIDNRINYDQYSQMTPGEILKDEDINKMFSANVINSMKGIIKLGNQAAHENPDSLVDCKKVIEDTEKIFTWFKLNYKQID